MRISLIGSGRVAHHLALALQPHHHIVQIFSRQKRHAQALADLVGAQAINQIDLWQNDVDLVIIAVSDTAIADTIAAFAPVLQDALCVHTSGSTPLSVLQQHHRRCGVLYPLQTFSKEAAINWPQTPLLIEAAQERDLNVLSTLAQQLSERVYPYASEQRLSLHLAAVFACNFSNYCYDVAKQLLDAQHVDFALLHPLMLATAQKATLYDPNTVQTGPAVRHDHAILDLHSQMLTQAAQSDWQQLYRLMSQQILQRHPQI